MTSRDSRRILLSERTWPEIAVMQQRGALIVIPTGSTEQHGWHLPLETDSRLAYEVAHAAASQVCQEIPVLLAPALAIGVSGEHMAFPGTLTLSAPTFMAVAEEVALALIEHGFRRLLFLNGHAGNTEPLKLVAKAIRERHDVLVVTANYWMLARDAFIDIAQDPNLSISHGGEIETAMMLHVHPEQVYMELARKWEGTAGNPYLRASLQSEAAAAYGLRRTDLTRTGSTGDPTRASREMGQRFFEAAVSATAEFFRFVHAWSIPTRRPPLAPGDEERDTSTEETGG